ncbi:hypothetical protein Y032_0541g3185 [Ancylostoma ceylanicum]|uniref:PAP-associated domain-containing protein n=1 Tax=Ancylostoma ceylanicum TaxID=53326 RepID=A0A016WR61_9BILA|nr:hypothetical protein Y032_0541g3185 [Ancylostoma ceylanicum]
MFEQVIQIRRRKPLLKMEKDWNRSVCIEDPFDLNHNLGSGVTRKSRQAIPLYIHPDLLWHSWVSLELGQGCTLSYTYKCPLNHTLKCFARFLTCCCSTSQVLCSSQNMLRSSPSLSFYVMLLLQSPYY